jgi:hypothetical protein
MTVPGAISIPMLTACHGHLSGLDWQVGLARAGVRRKKGGLEEELFVLAHELTRVEEELATTWVPDRPFYGLPPGWWIWVPSIYVLLFIWAMGAEDSVARIYRWCGALVGLGAGAVYVLMKIWRPSRQRRLEKEAQRPVLQAEKEARIADLLVARDALVEQAGPVTD